MLSIIRKKWNFVIILMMISDLTHGTGSDENDWFSQYGAKRDEEDGILQEDELGEDDGEGTKTEKECQQNSYLLCCLIGYLVNFFVST